MSWILSRSNRRDNPRSCYRYNTPHLQQERRRMTEVLSVREIVKTFGAVRAVDGVSFSVRKGTITGLLGRNGAGKTTTIRMITGIFYPDSGSIEWPDGDGRNPQDRIGYLPEERGLYRQMKIVEQLLFLAEIKDRRGRDV